MTRPALSFEFFPPKNIEGSFRLWTCVQTLAPLAPEFVSVTYGAGGTTRELTHDAVTAIRRTTGLNVAAHLTCVDATKDETLAIANNYAEAGVTEIVALRGDPPKGSGGFAAHLEGFSGSVELIEALAATGRFTLRVGAYPEKHPEAADLKADVEHLKRKIDAGASAAITQFFFQADTFLRFRDACDAAGIRAPILPGILPVENWSGARRFAAACGTSIPPLIAEGFDRAEAQGAADLYATAVATQLCDNLLTEGVEHLHFYTLNRPELTRDICHALGIVPKVELQRVA
ncbi:methylenetetrahydrofolate reductase [NAD(P)H] [Wenxinia marina]|uniref:Methylenetetrahydrofolate reductase n=1 Tax=Wenxinia marina DSM 24838 TaxID=1123501 RepID=A0A0D0NJD7_9RHOB|nr:methylenetetrahydrofolate reductase [NAD(P)H] [Wenxinia marina]KIQ68450.1 5,10-methylenetetrahydrofolate reductase (NAD(P)) [Wenxinia marina DSM 24838]